MYMVGCHRFGWDSTGSSPISFTGGTRRAGVSPFLLAPSPLPPTESIPYPHLLKQEHGPFGYPDE